MNTLMTHIVAGYPTLKESEKIAVTMLESGVAFLEIQIPFSDPVADGPTIMHANQKALDQGVTPNDCLQMMSRLTKKTKTPLLFMTYYNIVFRYGLEKFCKDAKAAGCYGLIIPDISIDEESHEHYLKLSKKYGLHPIQVISPITPIERLKKIGKVASGFVYCVSRTGTTGVSKKLDAKLGEYLQRVRKYIDVPIALGFGISKKSHVKAALQQADIAVIGSAIINLLDSKKKGTGKHLQNFLDELQ
jgi:tryptophan synthase alpha subunit